MNICLYFQVHQPLRLLDYSFFQIGKNHFYENTDLNKKIIEKIAANCYLPANELILKLIHKYKDKFKVSFSITGVALEQFRQYKPEVISSFATLANTGHIDILGETYYHSLSSLYDIEEFSKQITQHKNLVYELFKLTPTVFRNTELIYNNDLARYIDKLGYKAILVEGVDRILKGRSPNHLYKVPGAENIKCLLRNYRLSDDISFRYSDKTWEKYPLTPKKFIHSIKEIHPDPETINLFMDYETFGEHQAADEGIFKFLEKTVSELIEKEDAVFSTPSDTIQHLTAFDEYDVQEFISWADTERDLSAWRSNSMQYETLNKIYALKEEVYATGNEDLITTWCKLQTSDHFYYMCTKYWADGDVHQYFSPYNSPYDAYIFYMNILSDLEITLKKTPKIKK